ncbi:AI-2E family transporter [Acetobacter orientalis]|uniref:AI-2E family transporter n=1 Tax=Acetobacter orientalis TaxID=146474 RepID=A0A2Z5ZFG4_9PROT|nr:AI-2E family transporter [Acetobacter orientalis]
MSETTNQTKPAGPPRCTLVKASHRSRRGQEVARNVLALFILAIALYTIQGFMPALVWGVYLPWQHGRFTHGRKLPGPRLQKGRSCPFCLL